MHIWEHRIASGMTKEQVSASWGSPKSINKTVSSGNAHEQWSYGDSPGKGSQVTFDNGLCAGWKK
jgi:hypothetical protein